MVDCILAYAATVLVDKMTDPKSAEGREMLDLVKADARASKQILLLAHLCASSLQIDVHECMVLYWCHLTGGSLAYLTCPQQIMEMDKNNAFFSHESFAGCHAGMQRQTLQALLSSGESC